MGNTTDSDELFRLYGGTHIPEALLDWMDHKIDFERAVFETDSEFVCNLDAMSHVNKGVVGLRVEFLNNIHLTDLEITNLTNVGCRSPHIHKCVDNTLYKGADVRGISMSYVDDLQSHTNISISSLRSKSGSAIGVSIRSGDVSAKLHGSTFTNITGVDFDRSLAVAIREADEFMVRT